MCVCGFECHVLRKLKNNENFGGHHCPLSQRFLGSFETKKGQNAHFSETGKTLVQHTS